MNKISAYFNRPASFNTKPWVIVVIASLLVGFLLGFFQPFGIEKFNTEMKFYVVAGYTLVTAVIISIIGYIFPFLFRKFYDTSKWTIGKSFINNVLILFMIALGNSIFDWSMGYHLSGTFGSVLLSYILFTLIIGIIPALVSIFFVQNHALKKNLQDARIINDQLAKRLQSKTRLDHIETDAIVLSGTTKETVTLYPDNIIYLESSGNYVKINYLYEDIVKQKQVRNTIARIEKDLKDYPYIVRCHRAYMVNASYVINAEGNSQGFQLTLRHLAEKIPVSRTYIKEIREKL